MQFPVTLGKKVRVVEARLASEADVEAIEAWGKLPQPGDVMEVWDAAEYAGLGCEKWRTARQRGRLVSRFGDIRTALEAQPKAELIFLLVARADWHEPSEQVGFCQFRRTWAHNVFVDYLGTDPRLGRPDFPQIGGIGTGLLFAVMALGQQISAGKCLLEATDESFGFYRKKFRQMEINDLCALSPAEQWHYMEKTREAWSRLGLTLQLNLDPKSL